MNRSQILSKIQKTRKQLEELEKELKKAEVVRILKDLNDNTSLVEINDAFKEERCMIGIRFFGEYGDNALFLGVEEECEWEIVKDLDNCWCLIPKTIRKKIDENL